MVQWFLLVKIYKLLVTICIKKYVESRTLTLGYLMTGKRTDHLIIWDASHPADSVTPLMEDPVILGASASQDYHYLSSFKWPWKSPKGHKIQQKNHSWTRSLSLKILSVHTAVASDNQSRRPCSWFSCNNFSSEWVGLVKIPEFIVLLPFQTDDIVLAMFENMWDTKKKELYPIEVHCFINRVSIISYNNPLEGYFWWGQPPM